MQRLEDRLVVDPGVEDHVEVEGRPEIERILLRDDGADWLIAVRRQDIGDGDAELVALARCGPRENLEIDLTFFARFTCGSAAG
jgi:hypothetical protein